MTSELVQCRMVRGRYAFLTFSSKDLEPYRGRKVLIDETTLFNKHQETYTAKDKPLRIKVEMYDPQTQQPVARCDNAACQVQLDKLLAEGKKESTRIVAPGESLHSSRPKENESVIVEDDDTITIKVRAVCSCIHHNVAFFYCLVEILDDSNQVVFRSAFISNAVNDKKGSNPVQYCTIPLKTVV